MYNEIEFPMVVSCAMYIYSLWVFGLLSEYLMMVSFYSFLRGGVIYNKWSEFYIHSNTYSLTSVYVGVQYDSADPS